MQRRPVTLWDVVDETERYLDEGKLDRPHLGRDTVYPVELYEAAVREALPRARFTVLERVAHVPMIDDPELVARTILAATGAAKA